MEIRLDADSFRAIDLCMAESKSKKGVQLELELPTWGGQRAGAGRKRQAERPSVPHIARSQLRSYNPLLITLRMRDDVPDLRQRPAWVSIVRTMREFRESQDDLRFVHYSVPANHAHLIAEGEGRASVSLGMQSFCTRFAKAVNRCFDRKGTAFAGRYHVRELKTPTEVRNALRYVLGNARHHAADAGITLPPDWVDPRSTAATFDGWRDPPVMPERLADFGTSAARSWLLRVGWRRLGLLDLCEIPGGLRRAA
jgi:putative transposase